MSSTGSKNAARLTALTSSSSLAAIALTFVVAFGVCLRVAVFFANPSIWADEAALAQNIVSRSFRELLEPLDLHQVAPVAYMAGVKGFVLMGGHNEYALRALSAFASVGSLLLFAVSAKRYFSVTQGIVACGLFALCPALIMYGGEAKQYSFDVFTSVGLLYLGLRTSESLTDRLLVMLAAVGAVAIWCSHAAGFVLAPIGGLVIWKAVSSRNRRDVLGSLAVTLVWLVSFGVLYFLNLRPLSLARNELLWDFWRDSFVPLSVTGAAKWTWNSYWLMVVEPFGGRGEPAGYILAWLFAIGLIWLCAYRREVAWLIAGPLVLALLASTLRLYPFGGFGGRLLAFAVPAITLGSAAGWQVVAANRTRIIALTLGIAIFLPLMKLTARQARGDATSLRQPEELRPVIQQMLKRAQPGDHVYVFEGSSATFSLYADHFGYLSERGLSVTNGAVSFYYGNVDSNDYERDLRPLTSKGRVWVIYSNARWRSLNEEEMILAAARKYGPEIEVFQAPGASVRLFDFNREDHESPR